MSRPLRLEYSGAVYHITSRGNARANIFADDTDRRKFLSVLELVVKRFGWLCHSYCLMNNHYHLLIETPDKNLSSGMRQLNGVYTQSYNRRHRRVGHVFQGRFKCIVVDKDSHLLELCRYVVLNPVRANLVKHPELWEWSSYKATTGLSKCPDFLTVEWILKQFGNKMGEAKKNFREFVMEGHSGYRPWDELKGQVFLGNDDFIEKIRSYLKDGEDIKEIPRKQRHASRPSLKDIFNDKVKIDKKLRSKKIYDASVKFGYTMKEIASCLGIHYTTVSKVIKKTEDKK